MTENEAIDTLKMNRPFGGSVFTDELQEAMETAIQAIEEIQQYRETGLTPQMVKDLIKSEKEAHKASLENAHIVDEYRAIGTVEKFKALKEKAEPRKPNSRGATAHTWDAGYCPVCDCGITSRWSYCQNCGQRIDWKNEKQE